MALNREAERLGRLQLVARMLRDRDLSAVATALARCRESDQQIALLSAHEARIRDDLAAAADTRDMMQAQSYCQLLGVQMAGLAAERLVRAAAAEAGLKTARQSFARATVADALGQAAEQARRTRSARRDDHL